MENQGRSWGAKLTHECCQLVPGIAPWATGLPSVLIVPAFLGSRQLPAHFPCAPFCLSHRPLKGPSGGRDGVNHHKENSKRVSTSCFIVFLPERSINTTLQRPC